MKEYEKHLESLMYTHYVSLCEKDKRHYAAIEAAKLGHGGISYIAELFGCSRQTIAVGLEELKKKIVASPRIRRKGGSRISSEKQFDSLDNIFLSLMGEHIAGDPMNDNIKWVKLTRQEMSLAMKKLGVPISRNIVKRLLKRHGFVKRKMQRKQSTGEFKHRDKQFQNIEKIKKNSYLPKIPS